MAEYIERGTILRLINERKINTCNGSLSCLQMQRMVERIPAADVAPVRHARWFWADDGFCRCSECTQKAPVMPQYQDEPITTMTKFCPHCGSLMDGGADNGE